MIRYGIRPSNHRRWERIAQDTIEKAEREPVPLQEFYAGLVAIMDELDMRLSTSTSELKK